MQRVTTHAVTVVVVLGLALAGCSGDDPPDAPVGDGGPAPAALATTPDIVGGDVAFEELERLATGLVELHGGREAFARVWWALDRGYTLHQLVSHGGARLEADGTIRDVEPEAPAPDLLSAPPIALAADGSQPVLVEAQRNAQDQFMGFVEQSLGEIFDAGVRTLEEEAEADLLELIVLDRALFLLRVGYPLETVTEALVLGTIARVDGCTRIADIEPPPPPQHPCFTVDRPSPADADTDDAEGATTQDTTAPVEDGAFRGAVPESYFTFLSDPANPATLEVNQASVDVVGGQVAATVRWEVDGFYIDIECTSDRVLVIESVSAVGFSDGVADVPATSTITETFNGADCPAQPAPVEAPVRLRVSATGPDALQLEIITSSGDVQVAVPLPRS